MSEKKMKGIHLPVQALKQPLQPLEISGSLDVCLTGRRCHRRVKLFKLSASWRQLKHAADMFVQPDMQTVNNAVNTQCTCLTDVDVSLCTTEKWIC